MPRGIDHLVLCVDDLKKAGALYEAMGFTVSPQNEHPFGTGNRLVQLDGCFLEILTVINPPLISEHDGEFFSFGAFNRDFLRKGQGMSMLVLDSEDEENDRAEFEAKGLHVFEPFEFQRVAKTPEGDGPTVGFSLTFVDDASLPGLAFFTCRQWRPDLFWKPEMQVHANGAKTVSEVYVVSDGPASAAAFLSAFADTDGGNVDGSPHTIETARGRLSVRTPAEFGQAFPGDPLAGNVEGSLFAGYGVEVESLKATTQILETAGIPINQEASRTWIPSDAGFGCVIAFSET